MKISEEDTSKILVTDMPEWNEYSGILHGAKDAWKYVDTDYQRFSKLWLLVTMDVQRLMSGCIARGIRLAKEGKY